MAFINTVSAAEATGKVREMYERQQAAYGFVPHYATIFSHRPEVMQLWADLQNGIRRHMDKRRFELITVAAAMAVRSTYCSLAHGRALTKFHTSREVRAIVSNSDSNPLTDAEVEMMKFARKVAMQASDTTEADVASLKDFGFSDAEIFDIAATATARTFFAQLCEGLGTIGDHMYEDMDAELRDALTVGRPIDRAEPQMLSPASERVAVA